MFNFYKLEDIIFWCLGFIATIQLLSIHGITLFNIFLVISVIFLFLFNKLNSTKKLFDINAYCFISGIASFITIIGCCIMDLPDGYKASAISSGGVYLLILLIFYLIQNDKKIIFVLLNGFKASCLLTLVWCVLQVILYNFFQIDLNNVVFETFLKIQGSSCEIVNGNLIPSGFYTHKAILIPSFFFLFFSTSNIVVVFLLIIISFLTKSTSLIVGIMLCALFRAVYLFIKIKKHHLKIFDRIKNNYFLIFFSVIGFILFFIIALPYLIDTLNYVFSRFADITSNKYDNSSVTHFMYYVSFPTILDNLSLFNILFGTGFSTSGYQYTLFSGQYEWMSSWVVESDYINIFLNQGVIGFLLWLLLLFSIIRTSIKKQYFENVLFVILLLLIGIMYNIQFYWFILIEMALYLSAKNDIRVFDWEKGKILKHLLKLTINT